MAITKKFLINEPYKGAGGQYNFDNLINVGKPPILDDKFVSKDLYSLNDGEDINEAILQTEADLQLMNDSYLIIEELNVNNAGVSHYLNDTSVQVYIVDSNILTDISSYDIILNTINDTQYRIFSNTYGDQSPGWGPGTVIAGGNIILNIGLDTLEYNLGFNAVPSSGINPSYNPQTAISLFANLSTMSGEDSLYIIVRMTGNADRWWGTDKRKKRIQLFEISFSDLIDSFDDGSGLYQIEFDYDSSIVREDSGGIGGAESPAFKCELLKIGISRGNESSAFIEEGDPMYPHRTSVSLPRYIYNTDISGLINVKSNNIINWDVLNADRTDDYDFIPGTHVSVGNDIDIQSYYMDDINKYKVSSPNTVNLKFKIYNIVDLNVNEPMTVKSFNVQNIANKIKYKFFVLDWDDESNKIKNWNSVFELWPNSMTELITKQRNNKFKLADLYYDVNNYGDWISESMSHKYNKPGIKTIKAIVFSYSNHSDGLRFQPLRWKFVTIRIFLSNSKVYLEDFSDLGGPDFITLPWPHTTPIISGISEKSNYITSLRNTLISGKVSETDIIDETILYNALNNDELGDYLGKSDLEQVRVFNKPYDLSELLDITIVNNGNLNPHTDDNYWDLNGDGIGNTFPTESSVGNIFISDNMDIDLRESCILELNTGYNNGLTTRDSSGNGNIGFFIGDYRVNKATSDTPISRQSFQKLPETETEDGAL